MEPRCKECAAFDPMSEFYRDGMGLCRRRSPRHGLLERWPPVSGDGDWCMDILRLPVRDDKADGRG